MWLSRPAPGRLIRIRETDDLGENSRWIVNRHLARLDARVDEVAGWMIRAEIFMCRSMANGIVFKNSHPTGSFSCNGGLTVRNLASFVDPKVWQSTIRIESGSPMRAITEFRFLVMMANCYGPGESKGVALASFTILTAWRLMIEGTYWFASMATTASRSALHGASRSAPGGSTDASQANCTTPGPSLETALEESI